MRVYGKGECYSPEAYPGFLLSILVILILQYYRSGQANH